MSKKTAPPTEAGALVAWASNTTGKSKVSIGRLAVATNDATANAVVYVAAWFYPIARHRVFKKDPPEMTIVLLTDIRAVTAAEKRMVI